MSEEYRLRGKLDIRQAVHLGAVWGTALPCRTSAGFKKKKKRKKEKDTVHYPITTLPVKQLGKLITAAKSYSVYHQLIFSLPNLELFCSHASCCVELPQVWELRLAGVGIGVPRGPGCSLQKPSGCRSIKEIIVQIWKLQLIN